MWPTFTRRKRGSTRGGCDRFCARRAMAYCVAMGRRASVERFAITLSSALARVVISSPDSPVSASHTDSSTKFRSLGRRTNGFLGEEKRARSAIGKPMASLCKAQRLQPVESPREPGRSDCRQFRKALLGDSFILREHQQRSALHEIERQIPRAPLEASHIQPARFAQI